jgi:hypothetical protein
MPMRTIAATVVGQSHLQRGAICEDAYSIISSDDGRWTSAVLCDGCGSSRYAAIGAQQTSSFLAAALLELSARLDAEGPGEWVVDQVVIAIASLREDMRAAYGSDLRDYSATVVAAMVSEKGGFILHVGDGIATAFGETQRGQIKLSSQSNPKNGEYANETFYLTEPDWVRNVYITPISHPALVLLCTDGAQDVLYDGNSPATERVVALLNLCLAEGDTAGLALEAFFSSPEAARRSNDDKGCIIIYHPSILSKVQSGNLILSFTKNESAQLKNSSPHTPTKVGAQPKPKFIQPASLYDTQDQNTRAFDLRRALTISAIIFISIVILTLTFGIIWYIISSWSAAEPPQNIPASESAPAALPSKNVPASSPPSAARPQ